VHRRRRHGRPRRRRAASARGERAKSRSDRQSRAGRALKHDVGDHELKAIAALTLLAPFVPLLFQGEEWGAQTPFLYFTDHEDADLGRRVAEGRSREFSAFRWQGAVPNPQEADTFERSKLNCRSYPCLVTLNFSSGIESS